LAGSASIERWWFRAGVLAAFLIAADAGAYTVEPLLARDGFAGEPTCRECHVHAVEKVKLGHVSVEGLPARYRPGATYVLTVRLEFPGIKRAGFQLSARYADGTPAGALAPGDDRVVVLVDETSGVGYAFHSAAGLEPAAMGEAQWRVTWIAPAGGQVVFSLAANASNADDSALGDTILLGRFSVAAAR
jgi:hypothetical protein